METTTLLGRLARLVAVAVTAVMASSPVVAHAQEAVEALKQQQERSTAEYERIVRQISLSEERIDTLEAEIAKVKDDNAALTAALIQAAKTERKLGEDIEEIGGRLDVLRLQEADIRGSLRERRGVLAEVLGALQRMGLNPPPALLVRPEDALASVRSAILLGAVVPEMRAETEILAADLRELSRIAASIEAERGRLEETVREQLAEKERLSRLLEEKKKLQARTQARMAEEKQRASDLAGKARNLQDLISSLESEITSLREAEEARKRRIAEGAPSGNLLGETLPFGKRKGSVALPVAGYFGARFGDSDGAGGTLKGDILRTQSGAIVTAPADGTVLYAGPFRSYGQLLILNAGDGYHIVLAGMDNISVSLGQSVLAGEPLGTMGDARLASIAAVSDGNAAPELYVEFREGKKPVDPARWWVDGLSGRTANDT